MPCYLLKRVTKYPVKVAYILIYNLIHTSYHMILKISTCPLNLFEYLFVESKQGFTVK